MSLTYFSFVQRFAEQTGTIKADANPTLIIPSAIEYAEQRIYRELDLLFTQTTDATKQVSSGVREFTVSSALGTFITIDQINIITPAGSLSSVGSRSPLVPTSPEFLDAAFPTNASSLAGVPEYYAMRSNSLALLGPAPDGPYYAETIGIQRPAALSSANSSTILTQYIPDVFMAAAMVYAVEYMKDIRLQPAEAPAHTQGWEAQYQNLIKSAAVEQFRAKHESQGWTSQQPSPLVQRS